MVSYAIPTSGALIANYNVGTVVTPAQAAAAPAAGLTEIATATVSGGAVSSLSITVNLEAGKSYRFGVGIITTGATYAIQPYTINSDVTDGNYRRGIGNSAGSFADNSFRLGNSVTLSSIGASFGSCGLLSSTPHYSALFLREDTTGRGAFRHGYSTTETTFATLAIEHANTGLANGTWLTCWRLD